MIVEFEKGWIWFLFLIAILFLTMRPLSKPYQKPVLSTGSFWVDFVLYAGFVLVGFLAIDYVGGEKDINYNLIKYSVPALCVAFYVAGINFIRRRKSVDVDKVDT